MEPNKLTTASSEEIQAALSKLHAHMKPKPCKYCCELFQPVTRWQEFCCTKHRSAYHNEAATLLIEKLQATIAAKDREINELRLELIRMKKDD